MVSSLSSAPRVALVYDWVTTRYGGAEKVLLALQQAFPQAPIFTSVVDLDQATWARDSQVKPSWLQKIPGLAQHHRWTAPGLPLAFESLDLSQFDVVISVTSALAKGVLTRANQLHLCYLLTPPRYLYPPELFGQVESDRQTLLSIPGGTWLSQPILKYLRWWDTVAIFRPDKIIVLSELVADRCQQIYQRAADMVIYPPVEAEVTSLSAKKNALSPTEPFLLVISRLIPYKRIDLAIQACRAKKRRLVIIGEGPDKARLRQVAAGDPLIEFLGPLPPEETTSWLANCDGVLMPGLEDFGLTAAEAVAAGKPVVIHAQSGVAEILDPKQGFFLTELSLDEMLKALDFLEEKQFNPTKLQQSMRKYATTTFVEKWQTMIDHWWQLQQKGSYERE